MEQLILHLIGDYLTQSDWMAQNKTSSYFPALVHATVYTLPFLLLTRSPLALFVMWSTHFLIDRFRLARFVVWAKNFLLPPQWMRGFDVHSESARLDRHYRSWANCKTTGYNAGTAPWLAFWLLIIADNTLHISINYLSLRYL